MSLRGKEKIWFLVNHLRDEREATPTGQPIGLHPANDLNRHYAEPDLVQVVEKLEKDNNAVKLVATPTIENNYKYLFKLLPNFDNYLQELRKDPEYLDWIGEKPEPEPTPKTERAPSNKKSISEDNVQKRYDLLEYIDTMADDNGNALVQTATFKDTDPVLINVWLGHLSIQEGLIDVVQRTEIDNYVVYRLKIKDRQKFRDYVDELYRWIKLSVPSLSTNNFLAVFDLAYELHQKLEVSRGNTVDVADTPNTKRFPQLKDESIDYRSNALQFLEDYGVISKLEHDGLVFYHVTVTRRFFDRTYQTIMTRALQDGYVTYKKDRAATQVLAEESKRRQQATGASEDKLPVASPPDAAKKTSTDTVQKVAISNLKPTNYTDKNGVLTASPYVEIAIAKRGKAKRSDGTKYDQCHLMSCLFKSVNTLKNGVSFSTFLGVKYNKDDKKQVKKIRNTIDEINQKVADETTAKRLVFIHAEKIFVDKSYL